MSDAAASASPLPGAPPADTPPARKPPSQAPVSPPPRSSPPAGTAPFRRLASPDGKAHDPLAERRRLEGKEEEARRQLARVREARQAHVRRVRKARDDAFTGPVLRPLVREFASRVGEDEARIEAGLAAVSAALSDQRTLDRLLSQLGVPAAPPASQG